TLLNIVVDWSEFSVLGEAQQLHLIDQYNLFMNGGGLTHINGTKLTQAEAQRFFQLLFQLSYHGSAQEDAFNKPLAMMTIVQALPYLLEKTEIEKISLPSLVRANTLAMSSSRAFLVHLSHDGISYEFVQYLRDSTSKEALIALAGPLAPF